MYIMKFLFLLLTCVSAFVNIPKMSKKNVLYDNYFNNDLINGLGIAIVTLPSLLKEGERCYKDEDCPFIMKCCKIGSNNFCCSPNNFISVDLAYNKQFISNNQTKNLKV